MKHNVAQAREMRCNMQRHRIELYLLRLDFHKYIGDRMRLVVFVAGEQFDGNVLCFVFKTEHNQRAHDERWYGARQVRSIVHHGRTTWMAAQLCRFVAHLGAHHEHA